MSIMNFQGTRFARATALVTLTAFLAGCLPQNLKDGTGSIMDSANSMMGSMANMTSVVADTTGFILPGAKKGYDNRSWTPEDQAAAERAKAAFSGKSPDNLPIYDPTKPGEQARYQAEIKRIVAKYKGRKDLNTDEMMEVAQVVVPVARFIAQSRVYRDAKKNGPRVVKNPKGSSAVVIPAGMTVEIAMLTYCNDHGLPAPWSGEKLQLRSAMAYMPEELFPIYQGLHTLAATNPSVHYRTQSLVWWLRDTPCKTESLSSADQQMLNSASPNAMGVIQGYCMKQKVKDYAAKYAQQYIPAGAQASLSQYQSLIAQAQDMSQKANAFLAADLTDPTQALQLAQSAGLTSKLGKNNFLDNKYLKQALPVLNQSGLVKALVPSTVEDKTVAASLAAMEILGAEIGKTAGADKGSLANFSDLGNGLYAENVHAGGANNTAVRITNTSNAPQSVTGSDYVLTTVQDDRAGRSAYYPTQRLSIGPMVPVKVYPNNPNADRLYTEHNEEKAKDLLEGLDGVDIGLKEEPVAPGDKPCALKDKLESAVISDIGMGIIKDVVEATPIVSNILGAYNLITGNDWFSGKKLTPAEMVDSAINVAMPPGSGTLKKIGTFLGKQGYRFARKALIKVRRNNTYRKYVKASDKFDQIIENNDRLNNSIELGYAIGSGNICNTVSKAINMASSHGCKGMACQISTKALEGVFEDDKEDSNFFLTTDDAINDISSILGKGTDAIKGLFR